MSDPFALPPGPARRAAMAEIGFNVSEDDFTAEELQELAARAASWTSLDDPSKWIPIGDLYRDAWTRPTSRHACSSTERDDVSDSEP